MPRENAIYNLNKKIVTKEALLSHIQDIDIYRYYTGKEIEIGGAIESPLREDKKPSFGYFIGESNEVCFNDFTLGGGDCIKFVMLLFGLTYFEALSKIVVDFNLKYHFHYKESFKTEKDYNPEKFEDREKLLSKSNNFILGKKKRDWKLYDLIYWKQFGIDIDTLEKYNVEPVDYVFINSNPIKADKYAYCFIEYKDNKETYKIYQPFSKNYKWVNNHNDSIWQGWNQLPKEGESLIITKSLKDVMSIDNILNYSTVSLQSESVIPKKHIIDELKNRFKYIYIWYDNDFDSKTNWGRVLSNNLAEKFGFVQLEIADEFKCKDFSDLVKKYNKEQAKSIFNNNIILPF